MGPRGQNHPDLHPWVLPEAEKAAEEGQRIGSAGLEAWVQAKLDWQKDQIEQLVGEAREQKPSAPL